MDSALERLNRKQLQELCKARGIKANSANKKLVSELKAYFERNPQDRPWMNNRPTLETIHTAPNSVPQTPASSVGNPSQRPTPAVDPFTAAFERPDAW